jgi:capsular exopolysaccharide synthesis family protein
VAVGVAVAVTLVTPPQYAASVTFFVNTRATGVSDALQGGQFAQQRVKSYVEVLTSNRLAQTVATRESLGINAEDVQKEISARVVPDTVLVQATVTDGDRARALRLAQLLAVEFPDLVKTLETPPKGTVATVGVAILSEPRLADGPVSPQPVRNVGLAIVLGLIIGVGAAALRESLDTTVRTPEALGTAAGSPVLCAIPHDAKAAKAPLIIEGSAQSTRAEAMRQLRTNLQFVNVDRPLKSLVVTSAMPGEGKSTTACNLGIAFAEAGKRVLLIDADLRRPKLAEYLNIEGAVGLTNVLAGQAGIRDAVQPWGGSGLWVLPSGHVPPNPSELLASRNMADLLAALSGGFDVVIIDTPPVLPVTDAAVMATVADGCLLVSRHAKTTASQVTAAAGALAAVGARLHGCALNMVPNKGGNVYTYYSYTSEEDLGPATLAAAVPVTNPSPRTPTPSPLPRTPADPPTQVLQAPQPGARRPRPTHRAVGQVHRASLESTTGEYLMPAVYRSGTGRSHTNDIDSDVRQRR